MAGREAAKLRLVPKPPPERDWAELLPNKPHIAERLKLLEKDWAEGVEIWRCEVSYGLSLDITPAVDHDDPTADRWNVILFRSFGPENAAGGHMSWGRRSHVVGPHTREGHRQPRGLDEPAHARPAARL